MSEKTAQLVDSEVKRIITEAYDRAKAVLTEVLPEVPDNARDEVTSLLASLS